MDSSPLTHKVVNGRLVMIQGQQRFIKHTWSTAGDTACSVKGV